MNKNLEKEMIELLISKTSATRRIFSNKSGATRAVNTPSRIARISKPLFVK